ncbi:hypothetical protein [Pseudomonas sp. MS15a(2019)]|uniref:hypothetical protein n=1 Tax=Pseudomonas sp. MS15a(2019) TaxID=2579938 RepID=UPI0015677FC3|nr:hypothetical protein [Pseudomonas sp. MS15a(2019)]NRH43591.1 hypothetical protein [Pseudomonas sp. MS15a(2019)]
MSILLQRWQRLPAERRRLALGGLVILLLAAILLLRPAPGSRPVSVDWVRLAEEARALPVAQPLQEADWRGAVDGVTFSALTLGEPVWHLRGDAVNVAAVERLQAWARVRGWLPRTLRIRSQPTGVAFELEVLAVLVERAP